MIIENKKNGNMLLGPMLAISMSLLHVMPTLMMQNRCSFGDALINGRCQPCPTCAKGFGFASDCINSKSEFDVTCLPCINNTFSVPYSTCTPCRDPCRENETQKTKCTRESNRECICADGLVKDPGTNHCTGKCCKCKTPWKKEKVEECRHQPNGKHCFCKIKEEHRPLKTTIYPSKSIQPISSSPIPASSTPIFTKTAIFTTTSSFLDNFTPKLSPSIKPTVSTKIERAMPLTESTITLRHMSPTKTFTDVPVSTYIPTPNNPNPNIHGTGIVDNVALQILFGVSFFIAVALGIAFIRVTWQSRKNPRPTRIVKENKAVVISVERNKDGSGVTNPLLYAESDSDVFVAPEQVQLSGMQDQEEKKKEPTMSDLCEKYGWIQALSVLLVFCDDWYKLGLAIARLVYEEGTSELEELVKDVNKLCQLKNAESLFLCLSANKPLKNIGHLKAQASLLKRLDILMCISKMKVDDECLLTYMKIHLSKHFDELLYLLNKDVENDWRAFADLDGYNTVQIEAMKQKQNPATSKTEKLFMLLKGRFFDRELSIVAEAANRIKRFDVEKLINEYINEIKEGRCSS